MRKGPIREIPILLDLFSGAGGSARGYQEAGFFVVGVDVAPQPRYVGDAFVQGDAIEAMQELLDGWGIGTTTGNLWLLKDFSAIHASPPCQAYSRQLRHRANPTEMHIKVVRDLLQASGLPYVIENVRGAELNGPILCGSALGLKVWRHRIFETSFGLLVPSCQHGEAPLNPYNTVSKRRDGISGVSDKRWKEAMGVPWMIGAEAAEAIPPAFTRYIGERLQEVLPL